MASTACTCGGRLVSIRASWARASAEVSSWRSSTTRTTSPPWSAISDSTRSAIACPLKSGVAAGGSARPAGAAALRTACSRASQNCWASCWSRCTCMTASRCCRPGRSAQARSSDVFPLPAGAAIIVTRPAAARSRAARRSPRSISRGIAPATFRVNHLDLVRAFHLAEGEPGPVAKPRTAARGRARRSQGDTVTSPASGAADLPDYAPIPPSALGPALNDQGYHVGRVERNLYWVTDGVYNSAFLATPDGVVLFDAPPSIGHNLQRAVDEMAAAEGVSNTVTHLVYSHHHADHGSAASLFENAVKIGHEETRRLLARDNDPSRPLPEETFADTYTLEVGGERAELAWRGSNHTPDNIYIHFPGHDTLMFIDVVNAGWVPIYNVNLSEDVQGYMGAPEIALSYPWTHLISGHLGRLATREDVALHQQYIADIEESSREALQSVNPVPYYVQGGQNVWAGVKGHLDAVTERAAAPVVAKYTGVLAAADIEAFTMTTTFAIMQSLRLDKGPSGPVHP